MFHRVASSLALLAVSAALSQAFAQEESPAKSRIESLALFKNGLAVVSRSLDVDKPGRYIVDDPMRPIHGTFWMAPGAKVMVSGETRLVETPNCSPFANLQASLLGHDVVLHLREGEKDSVVKGKVVGVVPAKASKSWSRDYGRQPSYAGEAEDGGAACNGVEPSFVSLKKADGGVVLISSSAIFSVESDAVNQKVKEEKPVFIFDVKEKQEGKVFFSYLSKGISWAPSYRLRMVDSSKMSLSLSASIRNELEDFNDAGISVICGYPNIAASNVTSLLCADTTWAKFFHEGALQGSDDAAPNYAGNRANRMMLQVASAPAPAPDVANQTGESADIVVAPIGKLSLKEGGAVWMEIASAEASYERVVECTIPDRRDPYVGRVIRNMELEGGVSIWDAIRFKNPFKFPMTTAPVEISDASSFLGQCVGSWANPGAEALLRITKAMSVTAKTTEQELDSQRVVTYIGNDSFLKTVVQGTLTVKSFRQSPVKMSVKLQFSGDLVSAEGNPACKLRDEGVLSANKRNEAVWEISLNPGEEQSFKYSYSVLVNR